MMRVKHVCAAALALALCASPALASAQTTVTTPYWCGSYWSSVPCGSGINNYNYNYNAGYGYSYPYYPNYYPYNYYQYAYQQPACAITYSYAGTFNAYGYPYGYGFYNQPITLSWSSSNATSAYISALGPVYPYGTRVVYPTGIMTYVMTVYGPGGSNTCSTNYAPPPYPTYYQYPYNYGSYPYGY